MLELTDLTKRFGDRLALDAVSFTAPAGAVTGFLGPNGSGKTTTMRILLGIEPATSGSALVDGRAYADWPAPLGKVGALLDARSAHPGRTARDHLRVVAATHGISAARVEDVLEEVGIESVAHRRAGTFSLGMSQRLGIATALLGDPEVVILDEPMNGLDPDGVIWVRELCRGFAAEGRTVLVSSHLMSEMELLADRIVILGRGRVLANSSLAELRAGEQRVRVESPRAAELGAALLARGVTATVGAAVIEVTGASAVEVGDLAAELGVPVHGLETVTSSLESRYLALTAAEVEYRAAPASARE